MRSFALLIIALFSLFFELPLAMADSCKLDHLTSLSCSHKEFTLHGENFNSRKVLYAVPDTPPPPEGYPVVFIFHGTATPISFKHSFRRRFNTFVELSLINEFLKQGYVVIAPRAIMGFVWYANSGLPFERLPDYFMLRELFKQTESGAFGPINMNSQFAVGFSSGGYLASRIALTFENQFKAIAIHSASYAGCLGVLCTIPESLPTNHPPTVFLHGRNDFVVPVKTMYPYANKLKEMGIEIEIYVDQNRRHGWLNIAPKVIPEFFSKITDSNNNDMISANSKYKKPIELK